MERNRSQRFGVSLLAAAVGIASFGGVAWAKTDNDKFYQAYYLETTGQDLERATQLYADVVVDRRIDKALRAEAERRLAECREALATTDFARLMPPEALVYVELKRPGDKINELIGALGLLADPDWLPEKGAKRVAVSPALMKELLGIKGVALAITGFDPFKQVPSGVVVFDPGNMDLVRGLIETALPAGGVATDPIGGYPTYDVEGEAVVTLTSRLVIASNNRANIEGVLRRLAGKSTKSLADSKALASVSSDDGDALMRFFVNAKKIMPIVTGMASMATGSAEQARELQMAQAILDLEHLHSLSGRLDLDGDGLALQFDLRLDEGHRNLVYNFLRTPAVNRETLKAVPNGAAAFLIGALNEAASRYGTAPSGSSDRHPIVTMLDFGREIFANITSMAVYVLPPDGSASSSFPIPDAGLVITVNDPAKSESLWTQMLGVASLATGTGGMEGDRLDIDGVSVRTFQFTGGPTIHFATVGNDVLLTTNANTMTRSIRAMRDGDSVLNDAAFKPALARMSEATTKGLFVHAGRCAEIGKPFIPGDEREQLEPIFAALSNTSATFLVEHSDNVFRMSFQVHGVPDVGDFVTAKLIEEQQREAAAQGLRHAMKKGKWDEALGIIDAQLEKNPRSTGLLKKKFHALALGKKDYEAASKVGEQLLARWNDDATQLNNFAWALLTEDKYALQCNGLALKMSERSNKLTEYDNWMFLDTLALARFETGDAQAAVEWENKAIERCKSESSRKELENALARFKTGLDSSTVAAKSDGSTE